MELEQEIIYGPRYSRRFGWDLGINLFAGNEKICTFDCVYCQYGFTKRKGIVPQFVDSVTVVSEFKKKVIALREAGTEIHHCTFSGNGEPTMHPQFARIVREITGCRDTDFPWMQIAILTNGYRLRNPEIRKVFILVDQPIAKLDVVEQEKFVALNGPPPTFFIPTYLEILRRIPRLIIQTMFIQGWNDSPSDVVKWLEALKYIHPQEVQIYTLDRPPAMSSLLPVSTSFLQHLAEEACSFLRIPVHAYG